MVKNAQILLNTFSFEEQHICLSIGSNYLILHLDLKKPGRKMSENMYIT